MKGKKMSGPAPTGRVTRGMRILTLGFFFVPSGAPGIPVSTR